MRAVAAESVDDAGTVSGAGRRSSSAVALSAEEPVVAPADEQPVEQTEGQAGPSSRRRNRSNSLLTRPPGCACGGDKNTGTRSRQCGAADGYADADGDKYAAAHGDGATMPQNTQVVAASATHGRALPGWGCPRRRRREQREAGADQHVNRCLNRRRRRPDRYLDADACACTYNIKFAGVMR